MPAAPPALNGPPCQRCDQPLRILVEGSLVSARCPICRTAKVFAPATSGWAVVAEVGKAAA